LKILLVGNPNVGKSVIFNRLTGMNVVVSNYPGTTVDYTHGKMRINGTKAELIDVPGNYSLDPSSRAEEIAVAMIDGMTGDDDLIVNVLDATRLERNLRLTLELLETGKPVIVALNMWDQVEKRGIRIDVERLEDLLGVPVIRTSGLTGAGVSELTEHVTDVRSPHEPIEIESDPETIANVVRTAEVRQPKQRGGRFHDATIKPLTGIPIAILVLLLSAITIMAVSMSSFMLAVMPFFDAYYVPFVQAVSSGLGGEGFLHDILIGNLEGGELTTMALFQSMGLLTMAVGVPLVVLGILIGFYLVLGLLEDSGYLPRLAVLVDSMFHRIGLHGYAIVPTFLGLGCNVIGAFGARVMETRKQRFISMTLMAIAVPCAAQIAMLVALFFGLDLVMEGTEIMAGGIVGFENHIWIVFVVLILVYVIGGLLMNRFVKGEKDEGAGEMLLEIPPYRRPRISAVLKKLWMRIRMFLREAIPWLMLGILLINVLYYWGILDLIGEISSPVIVGLFGLPKEAVLALVVGFLRKDLAVGTLIPLVTGGVMGGMQLVIASVILVIYFPCYTTFVVMLRELGLKDMMLSVGIMVGTVLVVGTGLRVLLIGV
jgi:ferrous iron transport protein B